MFSLDHDRVRAHKLFNGHPDRFPDPMLKDLGLRYESIGYSNDQALVISPPTHLVNKTCKALFSDEAQAIAFPANESEMNSNCIKWAEVGVQSFFQINELFSCR